MQFNAKQITPKMSKKIVSSNWLFKQLGTPNLVILDASQDHPKNGIKGALNFNLKDHFSDQESPFPNSLPSIGQFEQNCRKFGINNSSKIVIYDNKGIYYSPRVWWMFKLMGHDDVFILNGGLIDWISSGYSIEKMTYNLKEGNFKASFRHELIKDYSSIQLNIETNKELLIDARSNGRYNGNEPEPRKGLRSGHIPYSINIPYSTVLENGKFKSEAELIPIFNALKNEKRPLIFSCGSGVTACIVLMASELILQNKKSVYDGSWTEWVLREQLIE